MSANLHSYDADIIAWANEQARLFREGLFSQLDIEHILNCFRTFPFIHSLERERQVYRKVIEGYRWAFCYLKYCIAMFFMFYSVRSNPLKRPLKPAKSPMQSHYLSLSLSFLCKAVHLPSQTH